MSWLCRAAPRVSTMQFVKNGPEIPERLLQAHEMGDVVFFCGAGISYPAKLPDFRLLAERLFEGFGVPTAVESAAMRKELYDTALGLLEARVVGRRHSVRRKLAKILTPCLSQPEATMTHEALLALACNRGGRYRLITTNFDRLFEEAKTKLGFDYTSFHAPLLPVPKKRWDGLVYLHGLLPQAPTPQDLDRLVLTSGDFGLAYLIDRWAARFVSELLRACTICFVGYSINDPVLRYMMDALAADRSLGESWPEAFAFGGYSAGKRDDAENEWAAKNVTPILYSDDYSHTHLHQTIRAWAANYRDGIRAKEGIVARYATIQPTGSTKEDDYVGRMLWALSDKSGLPAKVFAEFEPVPSIDWLEPLSEPRFGHDDLQRFGVHPAPEVDKNLAFSILRRPTPYPLAPRMMPVQDGRGIAWDDVMQAIVGWLLRHLDKPKCPSGKLSSL
jgi:hypothetical protein